MGNEVVDIDAITLDIEAIRARLAAATPGPWNHASWQLGQINFADADLIGYAPTDIVALLAEVARLRHCETAYDPDALLEAKDEIARLKDALELAHSDNGQLVSEVKRAQEANAELSSEVRRLWRIIDGPR